MVMIQGEGTNCACGVALDTGHNIDGILIEATRLVLG